VVAVAGLFVVLLLVLPVVLGSEFIGRSARLFDTGDCCVCLMIS
jgi:hypothetical protein